VPEDAPTITAGIAAAAAGDDVLVAPGTYFEHDIEFSKAIWVHSVAGAAATIIDGNLEGTVLTVHDVPSGCTIEGFTVRRGQADSYYGGGGFRLENAQITVTACVIEDCHADNGGGMTAIDALVTIDDCLFEGNVSGGGGAIVAFESATTSTGLHISNTRFIDNSASSGGLGPSTGGAVASSVATTTITECVFARNGVGPYGDGSALSVGGSSSVISGCTFVGNDSWWSDDASTIALHSGSVVVERCIIAFNEGPTFLCWAENASLACSDVHQNGSGDTFCLADAGGNFSADPAFCDRDAGDYTLDAASPCLPGRHPDGIDCGLIGAFGEGCGGSTSVETSSWGRIKDLYRNQ